ncbi:PHP domain-containing protein [bacterium]|nr:PHP domain-containing protein [bacterium]
MLWYKLKEILQKINVWKKHGREMTYYGDYHTHTHYSDGHGTVESNVQSAIAAGLKAVAITDHGYGNPKRFSLREATFFKQREEVELARQKYPEIEILHGIEADIISLDGTIDMRAEQCEQMDLIIGGFHRFAKPKSCKDFWSFYANLNTYLPFYYRTPSPKKLVQNTDAIIAMISKNPIDILAHINSCIVTDSVEVAKACAHYNVLLELNVKHFNLIKKDLEKLIETGVNFIVNSDAHQSRHIGRFEEIDNFLSALDIDRTRIANLSKPVFRRDMKSDK